MYSVYEQLMCGTWRIWSYESVDGKIADYIGTDKGINLVRDPSENEYPVLVINLEDGCIAFGSQYIRQFDGRVFKGEGIPESAWKELLLSTHEYENWETQFSHYDYLNATIDTFGELVFGKPNGWHFGPGMIRAHGDKCSSYMSKLEHDGVMSKYHCAMIFLLTYTAEFGDNDKTKSLDWIRDNYQRYKPLLMKAEEMVFEGKLDFSLESKHDTTCDEIELA